MLYFIIKLIVNDGHLCNSTNNIEIIEVHFQHALWDVWSLMARNSPDGGLSVTEMSGAALCSLLILYLVIFGTTFLIVCIYISDDILSTLDITNILVNIT